jgi:gamma-glutamyltranspeptidase/glutathione hydrolase
MRDVLFRLMIVLGLLVGVSIASVASGQAQEAAVAQNGQTPPTATTPPPATTTPATPAVTRLAKPTRSVVMARRGMVATSQPLAAQAGLDILQAGGNAADAAIAANAVLGVVEPMSCGLGGDLFVLYWDSKTERLYGLNASGRSPLKLSLDVCKEKQLAELPVEGPLSWSVPGCVDGWEELRERFGSKPLADLLEPAIRYSDEGFPVSDIIASGWAGSAEKLKAYPDSATTWLIDGKAPQPGEVFRNPRLAATLRTIAEGGRDAFYKGPIAEKIVAFSEANGGYFSAEDFEKHASEWVEPASTTYRGYDVWELPPNGQGIAVLQMLNLLEPYNLAAMKHNSPEYLHLLVEAKKLAFADRAKFYADPAFNEAPVTGLISKEYATTQRKRIDPNQAATDVPAGDPKLKSGDTIYLTVVDKDGNACSLIQSIYFGFGSQMTAGDLGFCLQNRGSLFALDSAHANCLAPGKRPFHTIIPGMVTKEGKPWFCFGVMGGDMQPQGHVQVLLNIIDFGLNVQQAGDAPRIRHLGSATPTGQPMTPGGGSVVVEPGISAATLEALKGKGHVIGTESDGFGGYQGILIDANGVLHGGTDKRKDGAAVGY